MSCNYNTLSFKDRVYLYNDINGIPLVLDVTNIEFVEEETLNERYRFNKSVSFTVKGYNNLSLLDGRYYIAIEADDGRVVMVTMEYEAFVTYEYSLNSTTDNTRYTYSVSENKPSDFINGISSSTTIADEACSYSSTDIQLSIILRKNIVIDEMTDRAYTYGDFDDVYPLKNTLEVSEVLSEDRYTKTVSFQIPYDGRWQYLIGEFKDNTYTAKINSHRPDNLYVGNELGLQPLYTINDNVVTVTFTEISNIPLQRITNEEKTQIVGHQYIKTIYDPCVGDYTAKYLLREKINGNGAGTNEYECYEGYESIFEDIYNITGTFDDDVEYYNPNCKPSLCKIETTIPHAYTVTATTTATYTIKSDCDWHIEDYDGFTITPTSGEADTQYSITITTTYSSSVDKRTFKIVSDDNEYLVTAYMSDTSFIYPTTAYIDCLGGTVQFTYQGCLRVDNSPLEYTKNGNILSVVVPQNTDTTGRTYSIEVSDCNGHTQYLTIQQGNVYEYWAYNDECDYICENGNKYYKEWRYTGTTSSNATITTTYRKGDLIEANCRDCINVIKRWNQTFNVGIVDGEFWYLNLEYESLDNGTTWTMDGEVELREKVENADMSQVNNYTLVWKPTSEWVCQGTAPTPPTPGPPTPDYSTQYLTFESLEDGNIITFTASRNETKARTISASTDNGSTWTSYTATSGGTQIATLDTGEKVLIKGANTAYSSPYTDNIFSSTKTYNVYGNIMSLIYGDNFENQTTLTNEYVFEDLFIRSSGLTSAENLILPATTLTQSCYDWMFAGCTSLTTAPELPATTLSLNCYMGMFNGCTSLTVAPELPATTLAQGCYSGMFNGCRSLTVAPELPATTLAANCYSTMFYDCTSLLAAPTLPATTLADRCYHGMFQHCTSLTTAPSVLPATTLAQFCYGNMFASCTSLTKAPVLPARTLTDGCYRTMFHSCTSIASVICLATDIAANECTYGWLFNVASNGTFAKASSMNDWTTGDNGIPIGWTIINY